MAEATGLRNNALPYPVYGAPYGVSFPILDADGDLVPGAASPDSEISKNGDTFADCTNEATEIATSSGMYYLLLTATELTTDVATVIVKNGTAGAKTTPIVLFPKKLPVVRSGTAQGGAAGSITLDSNASAMDDYYNGALVVGTLDGAVEARIISDYNGSTKVATVVPDWNTTPDSDDTFIVYLPDGVQIGQADARGWNGTAVASPHTAGYPVVTVKDGTGTGEINTDAGKIVEVSTLTGHTPQTGDSFARLGAPAGASVSADIAAIEAQTDDIGTAGAGLTAVPWNAAWDAEVQSEVQDAIEANHLDHLLAVTYDPANKPGAADALLNELVEDDGGVARYTANALEQAPTGGSAPTVGQIADAVWDEATSGHTTSGTFGEQLKTDVDAILADTTTLLSRITSSLFSGITSMAQWLGLIAGKQTGNSTARTELRATGAGSGTFDETTDSQEAIRDRGDAAWTTATGFSTHSAADVWAVATRTVTSLSNVAADLRAAVGLASANLDTQLGDLPTNAELATALAAADDAVLAAIAALNNLSQAQAQTAAANALTAYDPPTRTEATSDKDEILALTALVKAVTDALTAVAAAKLEKSAKGIIPGTVDTTGFSPTTTEFEADDITTAAADHYIGRIVTFTSGTLAGQSTDITDYVLTGGRGHFTVTALTSAPANDVTFVIT
jgi:hypothetical protein